MLRLCPVWLAAWGPGVGLRDPENELPPPLCALLGAKVAGPGLLTGLLAGVLRGAAVRGMFTLLLAPPPFCRLPSAALRSGCDAV
ncbi:hypothetical protein GDO78_021009 [Eleutherodactylus coqui]|uniref:Uncharacterized protein n=1 Tax=Eleutherodactylus coqui TaxID=57060 RepID=A0A8J6ECB2_ELECQ|nr:hypothetical protein GDO78_021009 [Eleutherodactylus coqui]